MNIKMRSLFALGKLTPASIECGAGWTLHPVWTLQKILAPAWNGTSNPRTTSL